MATRNVEVAMALTVAAVARIKTPPQGQQDHFDKGYPGLALRVSYGGARAWIYLYRRHGKLKRMTLGRFPAMSLSDARQAWRDANAALGQGGDPARPPPAPESFDTIANEWLKRDQAKNRSAGEVKRVVERELKPAWTGREFTTISRRDIVQLIDAIEDRGHPIMARRIHAHLHRLFRWSVGRGIIEINPMADLPKPGEAPERDRVLTDNELALIWKAAKSIGWPFGPIVQLLILTAARRDEIGALRWQEIDGDIIKLEGSRTKNGEARTIPLATSAVDLIAQLPHIGESEFVFTTNGNASVSGWSKAKIQIDRAVRDLNFGADLPAWRLHDLRRTAGTGLQRLKFNLQVVEAVLGHVAGSRAGIVGVYQRHDYNTEKRIALEAWSREIERITTGKQAAVLPMARRAGR
jgi:integrase